MDFTAARPLPANTERERDMLSALLSVSDRHLLLGVIAVLPEACFSTREHIVMYRAVKELAADEILGPVQFSAKVGDALEGGRQHAARILENYVPVSEQTLDSWATDLKRLAHRRQLITDLYAALESLWSTGRDPSAIELELAEQRMKNTVAFETRPVDDMAQAVSEYRDFVERRVKVENAGRAVRFGLPSLDTRCTWIPSYGLWMARTSHGKTALMANVSLNQVLAGLQPVVFSLEQPRHQMIGRYLSLMLECSYSDALGGPTMPQELADDRENALAALQNSGLTIISGRHTVESIYAECLRLKHQGRCDVVYIDQMSRIQHRQDKRETKEQAWTRTSNRLAEIWQELGVPVVLLAQLNAKTAVDHPRPAASHIKDCGSLLEDSCWQLVLDFPEAEPDRFEKLEAQRQKSMASGNVAAADRLDVRGKLLVSCTKDRQAVMGGAGWGERFTFDRQCGLIRP